MPVNTKRCDSNLVFDRKLHIEKRKSCFFTPPARKSGADKIANLLEQSQGCIKALALGVGVSVLLMLLRLIVH